MIDSFGRTIDYLRVSVTDRCNFRCVYCMPAEGAGFVPREDLLRFEEMNAIVRVMAELGVRKVRLTGGEPLVRRGVVDLVSQIAGIPGIRDVSMTTNGSLLGELAVPLQRAGLNRVNISLDSLRGETCERMSRGGKLEDVLAGIEAARSAGIDPIKLNTVVVRGLNDDEVADLAFLSITSGLHVRFIELMPIGWGPEDEPSWEEGSGCSSRGSRSAAVSFGASLIPFDGENLRAAALRTPIRGLETLGFHDLRMRFVSSGETRERIEQSLGTLEPAGVVTNGPAHAFRVPGAAGTIGFISQISNDLCLGCNRMRLTSEGRLRPCLMADGEEDLRAPLRDGSGLDEVEKRILRALGAKPKEHRLNEGSEPISRVMSQIGG